MKGFVFVNGFGLVKFKANEMYQFIGEDGRRVEKQYIGDIKYPKGIRSFNGCKWVSYNYYFDKSKIFKSRESAAAFVLKK